MITDHRSQITAVVVVGVMMMSLLLPAIAAPVLGVLSTLTWKTIHRTPTLVASSNGNISQATSQRRKNAHTHTHQRKKIRHVSSRNSILGGWCCCDMWERMMYYRRYSGWCGSSLSLSLFLSCELSAYVYLPNRSKIIAGRVIPG